MKPRVKEIEIKAQVSSLKSLEEKFKQMGCSFTPSLVQTDRIYLPRDMSFDSIPPGTSVLRIRQQNNKNLFTLKQVMSVALDKVEKEVEIDDAEVMSEILELLDYHQALEVNKARIKTKFKGYEICLDEVKGLGSFIEVEKMSSEDGQVVQDELFAFLETLGISQNQKVTQGYDVLLFAKSKK